MEYLFRMCGRIVEVIRYKLNITETNYTPDENGNLVEEISEHELYFSTMEEASFYTTLPNSSPLVELDVSTYEWMDGIDVGDVENTYKEAIKIYKMGEEKYKQSLALKQTSNIDQLRADIDYIMLMGGY